MGIRSMRRTIGTDRGGVKSLDHIAPRPDGNLFSQRREIGRGGLERLEIDRLWTLCRLNRFFEPGWCRQKPVPEIAVADAADDFDRSDDDADVKIGRQVVRDVIPFLWCIYIYSFAHTGWARPNLRGFFTAQN